MSDARWEQVTVSLLLDGSRAIASPSLSDATEVDTNQEGDSASGPTGLFFCACAVQ